MTEGRLRHQRHSIRLRGYDYAQSGTYYVTICVHDHACLFGEIVDGRMRLNATGLVVAEAWEWLGKQYVYVVLNSRIVMPNHLHGIIVVRDQPRRGGSRTAPTHTGDTTNGPCAGRDDADDPLHTPIAGIEQRKPLGRLIGAFKTVSTKAFNKLHGSTHMPLWQRNYYEHIIRDEDSLERVRQYIENNPARWATDHENPALESVGLDHPRSPR